MNDEQDHLAGRLKRYAGITSSLSSTAIRVLGEKLFGLENDPHEQAQVLAKALGNLKGPVMKIAQFLATVPDAIPDEYVQAFLTLQSQAPSMGWFFVKRRMRSELGEDWMQKFSVFEQTASAAASLGQVHKAESLNGEKLACKLQYPDMASVIEADLNQLKLVFKIYEATFKALSVEDIYEEIAARLREELDYEQEANHIRYYQQIFNKDVNKVADSLNNYVHIPKVFSDISTKRLPTMSWSQGKPLKQLLNSSQDIRNQIAKLIFYTWYKPFYAYGLIHGDPHPGNYSFTDNNHINLLDFGCVRKFSGQFVAGVIQLYESFLYDKPDQAIAAYEQWGFQNLSKEIIDVLNLWARMLYEPLLEDRIRPIQNENRGLEGRAMAGHIHQELKRLGGVQPPREFVFMDRAAVGIGSVIMQLKAEQNWYQLFQELIQDFNPSKLNDNQQKLLRNEL